MIDSPDNSYDDEPSSTAGLLLKLAAGLFLLVMVLATAFVVARGFAPPEVSPGMIHTIGRGDLLVTVDEQGMLESGENHEIKSKVRGRNAVLWIIESGSFVEKGDELVRLNALLIQEQVDERTKFANWSQSGADRSAATVARSRIAVDEYDQGRFQTERMTLEKDVAVAQAAVQNSRDRIRHTQMMANSGYTSQLEVEERQFAVKQAELNLEVKKTQLEVLKNFTYKEELQTLKGSLAAAEATSRIVYFQTKQSMEMSLANIV
ncbi:MAG: hypothetical protein AAF497_05450 [Planctomycetota bacterium]